MALHHPCRSGFDGGMARESRSRTARAVKPAASALIVAVVVAASAVLGTAPSGAIAGFGDVEEGAYYAAPVQWMVDNDITEGHSTECYLPSLPIDRGQAAVLIWRMEGEPSPSAPPVFADVPEPMSDAVAWLAEQGVTRGTTATTYSPGRVVNRAEFVTFLWRLADSPVPVSSAHGFSDLVPGAFYHDAVLWAVDEGITYGTTATTFAPADVVTRGQAAAFLYRHNDMPMVVVDPASPGCGLSGIGGDWFRRNDDPPRHERLQCSDGGGTVRCEYAAFADDELDEQVASSEFTGEPFGIADDPICDGYRGGWCSVATFLARGTTTGDFAGHAYLAVRYGNSQLDVLYDTAGVHCSWFPRPTATLPCQTR